jgi:hypothetical protein
LQENPRKFVLGFLRQSGNGFNGLFKQAGHIGNIVASALPGKA